MSQPGLFPYTRGIHKDMYRTRLWTMRQYAGFGSAKETNKRFRYLLKQGQTGLSTAFDLPTQLGLDCDMPEARHEVGRVGVSISHLKDMDQLLAHIPLDQISLSMTINAPASILFAMVLALAQKRKISWKKLRGTVQNDILKEYLARGTYIFPPEASLKLTADLIEFCTQEVPNWNPISVSGYHIREAGATAAEEVAFTLAHAEVYIEHCLKRKIPVESFTPKFSFFFAVHNHFFEEIAKFRAARKLWAELIKNKFKSNDPRSQKLRFHSQTGGATLTAQQPENNLVRVTYQALAAVLGGTQSLHTNSMDEALTLPSETSARLALRTQQIIAFESGIPSVADPLGGSEYLEQKTKEIETKVKHLIQKLKKTGGVLKAIESGLSHKIIEKSFLEHQQAIETGRKKVVGLNCYQSIQTDKEGVPSSISFEKEENRQRKQIRELKKGRQHKKIEIALNKLENKASSGENLIPAFIDLVKQGVTLGEICRTLKQVYGEYEA